MKLSDKQINSVILRCIVGLGSYRLGGADAVTFRMVRAVLESMFKERKELRREIRRLKAKKRPAK